MLRRFILTPFLILFLACFFANALDIRESFAEDLSTRRARGSHAGRIVLRDPVSGKIIGRIPADGRESLSLEALPESGVLVQARVQRVKMDKVALAIAETDSEPGAKRNMVVKSPSAGLLWSPEPGTYRLMAARRGAMKKNPYFSTILRIRKRDPRPAPTAAPRPTGTPTVTPTGGPTPTATATPAPAPAYPVWDVEGGRITLNGNAVFPRGFYYVSYYGGEKSRRLADLQKIAQAGYNFLHTPIDRNDAPLMNQAAAAGVHIVAEFNDDPAYLLQQFQRHKALAMLGTYDDVDSQVNGVQRYSPQQVGERSSALKALAANTVTYVSGGYPTRIRNYLGTSDTMGFQMYPVPYETLSSVTNGYLKPVMPDFLAAGEPVIANLQSFGWHGADRYPTASEVRNMTYQALIAGVQGILYYAYYDVYTYLNDQPALWAELTRIGGELGVLEPFLVRGARLPLSTGQADTYAAKWRLGSQIVVAAVNAGTASKTLSLALNESVAGAAANLFTSRPGVMSLSGSTLSGTLPAQSVQVYQVNVR